MLDDLDPLVEAAMAEWRIPGLSLAVVHDDVPVLVKSFGKRDLTSELPVTERTQFLLCSVTKSFTAAGLAMLADQRLLDWRKPVREYLPEFRLHDPVAGDRVTVTDLLCHRTGLPRHDWVWMPGDLSNTQMMERLRWLEPSRDLREAYQYSNLGYLAAGMVAERISGQTWQDFTRDRLLTPLGMANAGFSMVDLEQAPDSARPHFHDMDRDESHPAPLCPVSTAPAGGITADILGMANYLRFQLGEGRLGDVRLLSAESARLMQTPLVYMSGSEFEEFGDQHYGLGLVCSSYRGERTVEHNGGWFGWGTRIDMLPGRKLGVAVLTNRTGHPVTNIITCAVFDRICGREPVPWFERFRERRHAFLATRVGQRAVRLAARKPDAPPSHALPDYAGDYAHPAYSRIVIEADTDGLAWRFRGMTASLVHRHHDVFEVPERADVLTPDLLTLSFGYDRDGDIDRLWAPLEPSVADIVFRREPRGEALEPGFRKACEGTYRVGAQTHVVRLDAEGELTLSPSDQPTYRLTPYQARTFVIVELSGFRAEFTQAPDGCVVGLVFHQPNGTFVAARVGEDV